MTSSVESNFTNSEQDKNFKNKNEESAEQSEPVEKAEQQEAADESIEEKKSKKDNFVTVIIAGSPNDSPDGQQVTVSHVGLNKGPDTLMSTQEIIVN